MKKHRKLFRNCFLAILCIGLILVGGYTYSNAAGHGNPSSNGKLKLGKDGRKWLTIRVYSTDGKYDSSIKGQLPDETSYDTWLCYKFPNSSGRTNTGKNNTMTDTTTNTAATGKSKVSTLAWTDTVGGTFGLRLEDDTYTYGSNDRKSNYVRQAGLSYQFKIGKQKGYHFSATSPDLTTSSNIYVAKGDTGIVSAGVAKIKNATSNADTDLQLWKWGNAVDYTDVYNGAGATKTCSVVVDAQDFNESTTINIAIAPNTLTVRYDGNGGSTPNPSKQSANYGQTITWNTSTAKTGYYVTGWSCNLLENDMSLNVSKGANAMAKLVADADYGIERKSKSATLKAKWAPISYKIVYTAPPPANCSTANRLSGSTPTTSAQYDRTYSLPTTGFQLPGYHCSSNWLNSAGSSMPNTVSNLATVHNSTITLHHNWAPNTYSVQFNSTKPTYATSTTGATSAYKQPYTYDSAQALTANAYAYSGATFLGWSTSNGGTKVYNNQQTVSNLTATNNATVNLYAVWKPIQYYVRYNRNMPGATGPVSYTIGLLNYGTSYTALTQSDSEMSRDGYYIAYWTTNADGTGTRYYAGDKDWPAGSNSVNAQFKDLTKTDGATVDLYAHWEPIKYTLIYSKNDSKGGVNPAGINAETYSETHYYNETFNLAKNNWTRVNELNVPSVFRGWNLLSDCNNTDSRVKYAAKWGDVGSFINGDTNKLCLTRDGSITICTVWDDVPVVKATDYELPYNDVTGRESVPDLTNETSDAALSKTRLEEILLARAVTAHGDREDGELPIGKNFRIEYFSKPSFATVDHPTCYEIKYTVEDNTGNTYTQSAMLYAGYLVRIDVQ